MVPVPTDTQLYMGAFTSASTTFQGSFAALAGPKANDVSVCPLLFGTVKYPELLAILRTGLFFECTTCMIWLVKGNSG